MTRQALTSKQQVFVEEYVKSFNATQAAIAAGYSPKTAPSIGAENLKKPQIADVIKQRLDEFKMGADEVLVRLSEQAHADLGVFFKLVEEWTFFPLPSYEIIDAREVVDDSDPDKPRTRISYWVRHVSIDLDKVMDPDYSHLLHKFTDSPRSGLGIELYNKQTALQTLAKVHGLLIDKTELSGPDGGVIPVEVFERLVDKVYGDGGDDELA